eukprot:13372849-Alexandrium_andersonii.AAC.1
MSASLVGSEMCIRDSRRRGRPLTLAGASRRRFRKKFLEFAGVWRKMMRNCLLYTSDAADDM